MATRPGRDDAPSRSDLNSACAGGTAESAAASVRTRTKLLVETPGDDEPEGIVPRERFRAHLEPDLRLVSKGRVALALHDAQDVHRAHDAIHECPRDGRVRVIQEVITVRANSAIEISVVLRVPSVPVRGELSDVLIVLLTVVVPEVDDQTVLGGILILRILLDPPGVVPVTVGVGLELLLLRLSPIVVIDVGDPGHSFQSQVNEPPLLSCVEMSSPRNGEVHQERFTNRPVYLWGGVVHRRYGRNDGLDSGVGRYGVGDGPLREQNLMRRAGLKVQGRRSGARLGDGDSSQNCREEED